MPKGFDVDRLDVLLGMYGYFIVNEEGPYVSAANLKQDSALLLSSSYISLLLEVLQDDHFVSAQIGDDDKDLYSMTKEGILQAEATLREKGISLDDFEMTFRRRANFGLVVDTDHAQLDQAKAALAELKIHLRSDNDIGSLSPDDRLTAIAEVEELEGTLAKPKVRTHYLWSKANEILMWIIEKGAGSVVGEIAKKALSHIHTFINIFFN